MRVYVSDKMLSGLSGVNTTLFNAGNTANTLNQITAFVDSTKRPNVRFANASASTTLTGSAFTVNEWVTLGFSWSASGTTLYQDGTLVDSDVGTTLPSSVGHVYLGGFDNTDFGNYSVDHATTWYGQFNIFREPLTNAEMEEYTAESSIDVTTKHTYQLNLQSNLYYGTCGRYTTEWLDAGENCTGTPWLELIKTETIPAGDSIVYEFRASDTADEGTAWVDDITDASGRYIQITSEMLCADNNNSSEITYLEAVAQYS